VTEYITKDGDTADYVAWKFYGRQDGRVVEQLLEANPGLADIGPELPAGLVLILPEVEETQAADGEAVKLWD
jgi:phage tail protein X